MQEIKFIPPGVSDQLIAQADLLSIINHFHPELKRAGSSHRGTCPVCQSDRFTIAPAKGIIKCFSCDTGTNNIIGYLMEFRGMKYVDACVWLAAHLNYEIPRVDQLPAASQSLSITPSRDLHDVSFRDEQLRSSGITEEAQQITVNFTGDKTVLNRYTAGSVDNKFLPTTGHDMLLHYFDLDGMPIMYEPKHSKVPKPYIRIRHKHPAAHTDPQGKPIRYMSPPGSKNHLWIPEYIRTKFADKEHIETLVFVEGEKKADALCIAGIPAVGIAGIFNFAADNEMPTHIERLIIGCSITNLVFWFDSDLDSLGSDLTKDTDARPRLFAKAAIKFRAYFYKYQAEHINLQVWICHGKNTEVKGADDLLLSLSPDLSVTHPLTQDFNAALRAHTSEGEHLRLHLITSWSDSQIFELWHLHSPAAFMQHHKAQLSQLPEFRFNKHRYTYNADTDKFTSCQKLLPHEQYWFVQDGKYGQRMMFDFLNITVFLERHGFWRQRIGKGKYRFIRVDNNIVTEIYPDDVQEYVYEFTRAIEELKVLRMLMQGGTQYFGPDKLKNLKFFTPPFVAPVRQEQILCFQDSFWLVTKERITPHRHMELPGAVWKDEVIPFTPRLIDNFLTVRENVSPDEPLRITCAHEDVDIFQFMAYTSDIHWRDSSDPETCEFPAKFGEKDWHRYNTMMSCMMDKIIATGYTVSNFMDPAAMKAVIGMDAQESKSGRSEGGTGKSLHAGMFEHLFPVHNINGKQPRLSEDPFLYDGVDERTRMIKIDDCRRTTDFESFFSFITGGVTANSKGISKAYAGYKRWWLTTNFSIRGEDRSHLRRQYIITYSDFFNDKRDPFTVFGHSLFYEWDEVQWNYWYNFIASCLQIYMRYGLRSFAPGEDIIRRRLRDMISESWLDFFETYFYTGSDYINIRLDIQKFLDAFARHNPAQKNFAVKTVFKDKVDMFCRYAGYQYNLPKEGGRIRNGAKGIEYFVISDHEFDIEQYQNIIDQSAFDTSLIPEF